jgi:hypothetical protein
MLVSQLILGGYPVSAAPPSWRGPCRPDACLRPCCRAIIGARRAGAVWLIRSYPARYSSSFPRAALVWTRARRRPTPRLTPRLTWLPVARAIVRFGSLEPRSLQARSITSPLIGMSSRTPSGLDLLALSSPCPDLCFAMFTLRSLPPESAPPISFDTHSYDTTDPESRAVRTSIARAL